MRRLMLLRHAKSDWSGPHSAPDHDRVLDPRGREAAPKIGAYMARHGLEPDLVLCSTAARARETLALAARAFSVPPRTVYEARIYDADPERLLEVIEETDADVHALLLVGHNPGMQSLAELLIASGDVESRQKILEKYPTAGLAVIDFPLSDWSRLHPQSGRLDRFVTPRLLASIDD